jgi:dolichol-phosphate mannosyltransferase
MDADFSHDPADLPKILAAAENFDVVIGSRFVEGGGDLRTGFQRRAFSHLANRTTRALCGLSVRDCTSGFRCFRKETMQAIRPGCLVSKGPSIVEEVLFRASRAKARIVEVPIRFHDREKGVSKLSPLKALAVFFQLACLRFRR